MEAYKVLALFLNIFANAQILVPKTMSYNEGVHNLTGFPRHLADSCFCHADEVRGDPRVTPDKQCGETLTAEPGPYRKTKLCPHCVCSPGRVRNYHGECIPEQGCNRCKNRPNELYEECGQPYPLLCNHSVREFIVVDCKKDCFCIKGFIRKTLDGPCVPIHSCPPICDKNQEYSMCNTYCDPVCGKPIKPNCDKRCIYAGCKCRPGFVRDNGLGSYFNMCISESKCGK